MVAKAAAERLFEISVTIRRAKKEKMQKQEDEAKAGEEQQPTSGNHEACDSVDGMIYLLDYPQSKEEAFALARHSYSLNGVFEVNEVPKSDADDAEDEEDGEDRSDEDDDDDEKDS